MESPTAQVPRASGLGATTGAAAVVGAWAGVGSEHPARVARNSRMMKVAWRRRFQHLEFPFSLVGSSLPFYLVARPVPLAPIVRNLGALVPFQYVLPPYFRSVFSGARGSENPRRGSAGILGCLLQCS